jgi:putative SOS response-associated peptidase YedK
MCGRFTLSVTIGLFERFGISEVPFEVPPRYNIAPTQKVPVVFEEADDQKTAMLMEWGLMLPTGHEGRREVRPINVRDDSLEKKPVFSRLFATGRCLIPADGFYEWEKPGGAGRTPWYFRRQDHEVFAFAGICNKEGSGGYVGMGTCAIITTGPNGTVREIHDRMPVILDKNDENTWLSPRSTPDKALSCLKPCPDDLLEAYQVDRTVNDPTREGPCLVQRSQTTLY